MLFDNGGSTGPFQDVGGKTSSITCSVIKSKADRNGHKWKSDHPSTQHIKPCPGTPCKNAADCPPTRPFYELWCDQKSKKCDLDATFGERCRDDWQCREGFCDSNKCVPSRENGRCPRDSDCPSGLDCRPYRGPNHITRLCMKKGDPHSTPCSRSKDCKTHFACTLQYQGKWYCEWDPNGGCGGEGTDCLLGRQCCSGSCNLLDGRCKGKRNAMLDSQQPLNL